MNAVRVIAAVLVAWVALGALVIVAYNWAKYLVQRRSR